MGQLSEETTLRLAIAIENLTKSFEPGGSTERVLGEHTTAMGSHARKLDEHSLGMQVHGRKLEQYGR